MYTHRSIITLLLAACIRQAAGQTPITTVDLTRQGKLGAGTVLPAQCAVGQMYFKTNAPAGANVFACAANGWSVVGQAGAPLCSVTLSPNPVFDASQCSAFTLTLGATAVTASSLSNARAGQELTFIILQDATGGRSFTWPANVQRACAVSSTPGVSTIVNAVYDGVNAGATSCTTSDTPTLISGPTRPAPPAPATGLVCWFDSSDNTFECKDPGGSVHAAPLTTTATAHQFVSYIDSHGVQQKAQPADSDLALSDIATNNASASSHGFAPKLPNDPAKYLDGTGDYSVPAGSGGASAWPAGLVYYPGTVSAPSAYVSVSLSAGTTYCTDVYDPYTVLVSALATVAGTTAGKYQTVAVFDTSGNKLIDVNVPETSTTTWNKFTLGTPVTLSPGLHTWCTAWEAASSAWTISSTFSNALNPGTAGARPHNYTCSVAPAGSGPSFTIPANGNCASSGTKTAQSMASIGAVMVLVNP